MDNYGIKLVAIALYVIVGILFETTFFTNMILLSMVWYVLQFFQRLGLGRFHLVGQSLGAGYAIHYTSVHPEMVVSLTLLSLPGSVSLTVV